jgi:hypothetical protein
MNADKKLLLILLTAGPLLAGAVPVGFPFADESLTYAVKWPSGLSLGEARLSASKAGGQWNLELTVDASVPGYAVKDRYRSLATDGLCSVEFSRETLHGAKKANERTVFTGNTAVRQTAGGGGKTEISTGPCGHDALTFLFFARRELGQGKLPPSETILFGAEYQMRLEYAGPQVIPVGGVPAQADLVKCTVSNKVSDLYKFEIFFARDAARTPLVVSVPFQLGAIAMELVR